MTTTNVKISELPNITNTQLTSLNSNLVSIPLIAATGATGINLYATYQTTFANITSSLFGATGATGPIGSTGPIGTTGATGFNGSTGATGPQGIQGQLPYVGEWLEAADTSYAAFNDADLYQFKPNNSTAASVTGIKFNSTDNNGAVLSTFFASLTTRTGFIHLSTNDATPTIFVYRFSSFAQSGAVNTFTVTYVSKTGPKTTFSNFEAFTLTVLLDGTGSTGATGLGATGFTGSTGATGPTGATGLSGFVTGMIIMWSGAIGAVPSGWALCNGSNGTPDLRDKFIVGSGTSYNTGDTGGSADAIVVQHTHTASSVVTDPGHNHTIGYFPNLRGVGGGANLSDGDASFKATTNNTTGITVATSILSTGSSGTNANLPPYYALAFIMKL